MKKLIGLSIFILAVSFGLSFPNLAMANLTGCPSSWNLKVELQPGKVLTAIKGEDAEAFSYENYFYESTGQLESAIKQFGRNISYQFVGEWSQDGVKWYDVLRKTTDDRGYFTNSFEAQPGVFVHFDQLFRYFQGGKWRMTLKVETADCPQSIGYFTSSPITLRYSIFDLKRFDLRELYLSKTTWNFKDVEWHIQEFETWKARTLFDLNSNGISRSVPDLPNSANIVVSSKGNPPCMNYVNRNWRVINSDCGLEVFYVHRISLTSAEYYLVDQLEISYFSSLRAKAEAEAKAKAQVTARKTIVCIKGKIIKKVTGSNPRCPKGYVNK